MSKLKERYKPRRKAQSMAQGPVSLHQANREELEERAADAGIRIQRRSIKRMSLARLRKTSEFSGLRPLGQANASGGIDEANGGEAEPAEEYRRIKGLKSSKVPMMVYSHGGFSRCSKTTMAEIRWIQNYRMHETDNLSEENENMMQREFVRKYCLSLD